MSRLATIRQPRKANRISIIVTKIKKKEDTGVIIQEVSTITEAAERTADGRSTLMIASTLNTSLFKEANKIGKTISREKSTQKINWKTLLLKSLALR